MIVLEPGCDEDTVTHEFLHHMRRADAKRSGLARSPFPTDEHGYTLPGFYKSKDFGNLSNLEEAATVAEAACRTRYPVKVPTGYYSYTDGKQPTSEKYAGDRAILISGKKDAPKRGYWATKKVEKEFGRTNISTLKYKSGLKAIEVAELSKPVLERGDATGYSGGRTGVTTNRKGTRI